MPEILIAALFGLIIGSFLNVCIERWPRDHSVVWPRSRCTACGHSIWIRDNVPLASFVLLGGRCRHCRGRISWRYPVVEALTAACFAAAVWGEGLTPSTARLALFSALQIGAMFSDLETRLLPDQFTIGGMYLGFGSAWLAPQPAALAGFWIGPGYPRWASLADSLLAAGLLSGALWLTGWLYGKIRHREGLGFGDVKMIAAIGAFLGIGPAFGVLFLGCAGGALIGYGYIKLSGKDTSTYELPLGTFLGAAALVLAFARR